MQGDERTVIIKGFLWGGHHIRLYHHLSAFEISKNLGRNLIITITGDKISIELVE